MTTQYFPGILDRVKAVMLDSVVIIALLAASSYFFSSFESIPDGTRLIALVFIFILYDPIFTSSFGGTIGHMIIGIRVKREDDLEKNLLLPFAIVRFLVKALLGWISLLSVSGNEKRMALHDMIVRSVVVYK